MADRRKTSVSKPDAVPAPPATALPEGGSSGNTPAGDPAPPPPLEIASEVLLAGRTEIQIRHRGEIYRLTLTRAGKLILHK